MLIIYVTPIYLIIRLPGYEVASLALSRVAIFVILLFWAIQLLRRGLDESSNKRGVVAFGVVSFIGISKHRRVLECCPELTSHWFSRFHPDHDPCTNPPRSSVSRFQDLPGKSLLHRGRRAMDILGCFLYWSVPAYPTVFFEKKKKLMCQISAVSSFALCCVYDLNASEPPPPAHLDIRVKTEYNTNEPIIFSTSWNAWTKAKPMSNKEPDGWDNVPF